MKLRDFTLEKLAEMVVGNNQAFSYRSSYFITQFFTRCDLPYRHDGSTRHRWANDVLAKLNLETGRAPDLQSTSLIRVMSELFDRDDFDRGGKSRDDALAELNRLLTREGLAAYFDESGRPHICNTGTGTSVTATVAAPRPLSPAEIEQHEQVDAFLDSASEDEFMDRDPPPLRGSGPCRQTDDRPRRRQGSSVRRGASPHARG